MFSVFPCMRPSKAMRLFIYTDGGIMLHSCFLVPASMNLVLFCVPLGVGVDVCVHLCCIFMVYVIGPMYYSCVAGMHSCML